MPVRELVLVNAQHGDVSLHFNQVDTAWTANEQTDDVATPAPEPQQLTKSSLPNHNSRSGCNSTAVTGETIGSRNAQIGTNDQFIL